MRLVAWIRERSQCLHSRQRGIVDSEMRHERIDIVLKAKHSPSHCGTVESGKVDSLVIKSRELQTGRGMWDGNRVDCNLLEI